MKITNITNLKGKISQQLRISLAKKSGVTINVTLNPGDFIFAENIYNNNILRIYEKKKFLVLEDEKPLEEQEMYLVYKSTKSTKTIEDTLREEVLAEKDESKIELEDEIKVDKKTIEKDKLESEIELEENIEEDEMIQIEVMVPEESLTKNKGGRPKGSKNKPKRGRPKVKKPIGRPKKKKK
jgi:hypothetical protein